jgi:hypothetical protein
VDEDGQPATFLWLVARKPTGASRRALAEEQAPGRPV